MWNMLERIEKLMWWDPKHDKRAGYIAGLILMLVFFLTVGLTELVQMKSSVTP